MNLYSRRNLVKGSLAGLSGLLLGASPSLFAKTIAQNSVQTSTNQNNTLTEQYEGWFSAQGAKQNSYGFAYDLQGQNRPKAGLSGFRGHGGAQHPTKAHTVLLFGRRPNNQSIEVNLLTGEVTQRFYAAQNRHFFGHGAFSEDGKTLFTTEANLNKNTGVLGIRDANTYELLGEYPTYGIGPHQLMLMPKGKELVIANGGILTRPESGRKKLNLDSMSSNLSYVDVATGKLNAQWQVPEAKASIRHLDVAEDGSVAIAMQMQRAASQHANTVALAGVQKGDQPIKLLDNELITPQLNDYVGSVVIHNASRIAGFTSPRGDIVGFWNLDSGELVGYHSMRDVCGIAVSNRNNEFIVTNSYGAVHYIDAFSLKEQVAKRQHYQDIAWDNHMVSFNS